jgi:squalene-hopene/tetraprenyl-beta-curcumene cyclase
MPPDHATAAIDVEQVLADLRRKLLDARTPAGHWEGELSSSALSTATATFALALHLRRVPCSAPRPEPYIHGDALTRGAEHASHPQPCSRLIDNGLTWLLQHQNPDGGWGDTTKSLSNISTTALCWAALTIAGNQATPAIAKAEQWLTRAAGSLNPEALANAIAHRYGKDRTFSVPILTMCSLAGRLGDPQSAWRHIPQLPFELAALPQSWFRFFRLSVVSYALPALISMGLARHRNHPSRNPLTRLLRRLTTNRVLRVLTTIQPPGGGFLEATPLTSFVVMSLIGAGRSDHPVVAAGVDFLTRSTRPDGSWPIDTNLATWVTTLSVNALAAAGPDALAQDLPTENRRVIREWLLNQQYQVRHPYTGAAPGAWAWTDLPGGVPDADDTAGALLALHNLGDIDDRTTQAAVKGISWLLAVQNRDGGIPTFCRGWTNLPFDRSGPDLTAHVLLAWSAWRNRLHPKLAAKVSAAIDRALRYLASHQRLDGSWLPLWFGNQSAPDEDNPTYGTSKVLSALATFAPNSPMIPPAVNCLLNNQNADGGWGGAKSTPSTIEETSVVLHALACVPRSPNVEHAITQGIAWLSANLSNPDPTPIGLYFAKLWYFEKLYPLIFATRALTKLSTERP